MSTRPVIALVVCAAPPALRIRELIDLLMGGGWSICVTATPTAASWIDRDALARQTGYPVRVNWRLPEEPDPHPTADVVVVAPATFNVMNKWAQGINDTPALGILNQSLGAGLPVFSFPNVKAELARHPAYATSIEKLRHAGAVIVNLDASLNWRVVTHTVTAGRDKDVPPRAPR